MRVMFMGTPEFAVPCLESLFESGHSVCAVVTQPDKPKDRGQKVKFSEVKECALKYDIEVLQPQTLKDNAFLPELDRLKPDIIIVVAYGKILPEYILNHPKFGCVNIHASLLPKYRGAAPIQWSVINGETETGITSMHMAKGLDTGDMILKEKVCIGEYETAGELHDKLARIGAKVLIETIVQIEKGTAQREKQNEAETSDAPLINKEIGKIDWNKTAWEVVNLVRGTKPWPLAYTFYNDKKIKIITAKMGRKTDGAEPGKVLGVYENKLEVACADDMSVLVEEIQADGGKRMPISSYLNGHTLEAGMMLT